MICLKCGKQISDSSKFCPYCGASVSSGSTGAWSGTPPTPGVPSAPGVPPTPGVPSAPGVPPTPGVPPMPGMSGGGSSLNVAQVSRPGKKGGGKGLIIGAVAAVVVLAVVIAAAFASGLLASPKGTVEKALAKTAGAYIEAIDAVGLPDLAKLEKEQSFSQTFSLAVNRISPALAGQDLSFLEGLGLRLDMDLDRKGREMDGELACFYNGEDLASLQMLVDNEKLLLASPEFTKGSAYGFDTTTLGADLYRLGAEDEEIDIEKIGFNLFDLIEEVVPTQEQTEEMEKAMEDARKALAESIKVEKGSKESIQVNGKSIDALCYHVVIPQDAMSDYVKAVEAVMKQRADTRAIVEDVLRSMGFEEDMIGEALAEMGDMDVYGEMADDLERMVKALGDVELDVYISGGYVCAVEYSGRIEGKKVELGLYLGGGENFVDDLSMELSVDGDTLSLESTGNHSGKKGVFTDETTLKVDNERVTSALRYEPEAGRDNFAWELKVNNTASVVMEGQLTAAKDSFALELEELSLKAAGSELLSLEMGYAYGSCKGMKVSMSNPTLLGNMSEDDLMEFGQEIGTNAAGWLYDLEGKYPGILSGLLY